MLVQVERGKKPFPIRKLLGWARFYLDNKIGLKVLGTFFEAADPAEQKAWREPWTVKK
jgi:hypothetical protein